MGASGSGKSTLLQCMAGLDSLTSGRVSIAGQDVTPFVLSFLHERSGGRTQAVNRDLIADNAALAAEVAVAEVAS